MKIELEKVVAIAYKLSYVEGNDPKKLIESVDEKEPMYFLYGNSGLPMKFEDHLEGLVKGDTFDFSLSSEDGFGEYLDEEIIDIPIEEFLEEDGKLDKTVFAIGRSIPMTDEHGHHVRGNVLEINELAGYIKMDFNHPLAGKNLHFVGKITEVRDASKEELEHGHVHGEGGHHH